MDGKARQGNLVWIGNWGDGERSDELEEFLVRPIQDLKLRASVFGVRYPAAVKAHLARAGIDYGGWIPNFRVPEVFGAYQVTVHVPRGPYVKLLPGIPTIRPFEALACGIPLVCSPWEDLEGMFKPGHDFLMAHDGNEMKAHLRWILSHPAEATRLREHGIKTIRARHTCGHRVDQLLQIVRELQPHSEPINASH